MSFLGRLLAGALEAILTLLDALGARGVRWEWKKRTWRQALEARIAVWENLERGVRTRMRMCRSCRTLVEGSVAICPACGASMRMVPGGGVARLLRLVLPGVGSLSMILVSANIAMSLLVMVVGTRNGVPPLDALLSPSAPTLFLLGAKWTPAILGGEVWRLVTAGYLHGGLLHLLFNSYALMSLGPLIEESFGARKLFVIYSACGIAGFVASTLVSRRSLSIGASASIFGLLAFAVVFGRYRGGAAGRALASHLLRWLMFGVVLFLIPGIDNAGHFGGAAVGAVLGRFVDPGEPRTPAAEGLWRFLLGLFLLVTLGSFAALALSYAANRAALGA